MQINPIEATINFDFVEQDGRMVKLAVSVEQPEVLRSATRGTSLMQRRAQLEGIHGAWFTEQKGRFEANGLWCDDLRVW